MSRKRNPYIPLFTHDIMSSAKCRRLSMRATGLYLWLFCLMNEKPQQGRWALSTNEDHPTWKNSLTYRALQNADKYARLPMFATLMARQFLPWKSGQVLKALQELYRFKLIVVEDDAIIQPRMYNDNGFKLREDTMREYLADDPNDTADDPETDLAESYREALKKGGKKGGNNGTDKGTKKDPEKVHGIHARALRAESESENNINNIRKKNNSIGSKKAKNAKFVPPTLEEVQQYCNEKAFTFNPIMFFNHYEANGWVQGKGKPIKSWKACCATWQQRETSGEFSGQRRQAPKRRSGDIPQQVSGDNFDNQDSW